MTVYPGLDSFCDLPLNSATPLRLCIVTPDLLGPVKNGGIGTACGYLAYDMAEAGHDVEILFSQTGAENLDSAWIEQYAAKGIKAFNASALAPKQEYFPAVPQLAMAKHVYDFLKNRPPYDLILFMDWQGCGFYAMHAKKCGLAFQNTVLGVVIHSPTFWHCINNATMASNPSEAVIWHMERKAISMADIIISPSRYMLAWTAERLAPLPEYAIAEPNLLELDTGTRHEANAPINEIVFFGRLEFRKGLEQFCSALDILAKKGKLPEKVTFLGKCSWMGEEHSLFYISRRARKWNCRLNLELHRDHDAAVEYICGPGRMAVMPSIADNSPYTVYECLVAGVPFLARNVGGIGEFLPAPEHSRFLFGDNPHELAQKIADALGRRPERGTLAFDPRTVKQHWLMGLPRLVRHLQKKAVAQKTEPLISVILTHYNRPTLLKKAVQSLLNQTAARFEVILADDGSTDPEALALLDRLEPVFAEKGWKILRLDNRHAAATRNRGAKAARGQWLLFFDDDNVAMPHMLEKAACAAANLERGVVPFMFRVFEGAGEPDMANAAEIFLPTGDAVAYGVIANTLGDTCSLIHRDSFNKIGGFREDYGIGHEDYELFLRLALAGEPAFILPEPLFWYRRSEGKASVQLNTNVMLNRMRSLRPFLEALPPHLAELALMTHSMGDPLHLYPEPDAEYFCDLPIDRKKDPNDLSTLTQAATILATNGDTGLANQVFAMLPEQTDARQQTLLLTRAMGAARRNDTGAIRKIFREAKETGVASMICDAIFENLSRPHPKLRAELLSFLAAMPTPDTLALLLLAEAKAGDGRMDEATLLAVRALAKAEEIYVGGRPDIGEAIRGRAFLCGLHHFLLHGLADKYSWPQRQNFSRLLKRYPNLIAALANAHMLAWKYEDEGLAGKLVGCLIGGYTIE